MGKNKELLTKEDLKDYGNVVICGEIGDKFIIKITDGFDPNAKNTFGLMKKISDAIGEKYPIIEACESDHNLFEYILIQKRK